MADSIYKIFLFIFDVFTGLVLACCAYYLTKSIKNLISKKSNTCLLGLHVINVLLVAGLNMVWFYLESEEDKAKENDDASACSKLDNDEADLETSIAWFVSFIFGRYLDMFLLYLLFRFSRQ